MIVPVGVLMPPESVAVSFSTIVVLHGVLLVLGVVLIVGLAGPTTVSCSLPTCLTPLLLASPL